MGGSQPDGYHSGEQEEARMASGEAPGMGDHGSHIPALGGRFARFATVGALGVGVNLGVVAGIDFALSGVSWAPTLASASGIIVSIFTNFVVNDRWTWRDRDKSGSWVGRLGRYYAASAVAGTVQFVVAQALVWLLAVAPVVAQLGGIGVGLSINFTVNNLWTFSRDQE